MMRLHERREARHDRRRLRRTSQVNKESTMTAAAEIDLLTDPMGPDELRAARAAFGVTLQGMADMLGLTGVHSKDTVRAWESGRNPVSGPAAVAIRLLLERRRA